MEKKTVMEKMCQLNWGKSDTTAPTTTAATDEVVPHGPLSSEDAIRRMIRETGGLPSAPAEMAKTPADEAEFLLQVAAEVEHGLLVQYLYAAYSFSATDPTTPRGRLIEIAIQEMDHLLNVQNMLLALKRKPYFGRGNFPLPPDQAKFYPFPFRLEPLSQESLGKYVTTESPLQINPKLFQPEDLTLINTWLPRATSTGKGAAGQMINHVGVLYATLYWMFQDDDTPVDPWRLPKDQFAGKVRHVQDTDLADAAILDAREGNTDEFRGQQGPATDPPFRVIWNVKSRADARNAIAQIAAQGEGPESGEDSHFLSFLRLFSEFVTAAKAGTPLPVLPLPTNPNTGNDPATIGGRITHPVALLWARLFNVRYRILLTKLALALSESVGENTGGSGLASRDNLVNRSINREMKGAFGLRGIANQLITLPLHADGTGKAAPPFEMPDTPLPTDPKSHRDFLMSLFAEAATIIDQLLDPNGPAQLPAPVQTSLAQWKAADAQESADVAKMTFTP